MPLKTVVIGPKPSWYTSEQIVELREFVDNMQIKIPPGISEWSVGNRILVEWSDIGIPGPVSMTRNPVLIRLTLSHRIL